MERVRATKKEDSGGSYFSSPAADMRFVSTGCSLLDCVLGGGWALGRMGNIIGDKSTGKTLLAIEACANFAREYPSGYIWYREVESAFDEDYAEALGMPIDRIDFGELDENDKPKQLDTIEQFAADLQKCCDLAIKKNRPGLYILDSMDALSDQAETARKFTEKNTFGTGKAKMNSELFRRLTRKVEQAGILLLIVSQIRDNIGAMFGDKTQRAGGHALDFYCSQALKLAHIKTLVAERGKIKRATGVRIKAKCVKNKIALPFRECEFVIRFGYGVESYEAGLQWMIDANKTKMLGLTIAEAEDFIGDAIDWDAALFRQRSYELNAALKIAWADVERTFLPTRKKY